MNFDYLTEELKGKKLKQLVNDIINTNAFQRLQHIDQMGMVSAVYPTALHTRYAHSLGTAYLCLKVLDRLDRLYLMNSGKGDSYEALVGDEMKKYAFVAALLHDIGHGPFSHAFEEILGGKEVISHEDWAEYFFLDSNESFFKLLDKYGQKKNVLADIIKGKYVHEGDTDLGVAADLISSQLDVDRMDYLLRDSYFTGIAGCKIDLDWILNHFVVFSKEELKNYKQDRARLGVSVKAAKSIAHMLLTRRRVFSAVCYHKKVRLLEKLLIQFLEGLITDLSDSERPKIVEELSPGLSSSALGNFLKLCYDFKRKTKSKSLSEIEIEKKDFMREAYPYYKGLTDADIWMVVRNYANSGKDDRMSELAHCIYSRNLHKAFSVTLDNRSGDVVDPNVESIELIIKKLQDEKWCSWDWKILLLKSDVKLYEDESLSPVQKEVFVKGSSSVSRLDEVSPIIHCCRDIHSKQCYLMIHKSLVHDDKMFGRIKEAFKDCKVDFG